jgi:hypothetical protein
MAPFYAHSSHDGNPPPAGWQPLAEHLRGVAQLARKSAEEICLEKLGLGEAAYTARLLHDLGKHPPEFQQMLLDLYPQNGHTWHKQAVTWKTGLIRRACSTIGSLRGEHERATKIRRVDC